MPGKLWVIATPIGNLGDFSPRAKETIQQVDLLACESTSAAQRLCSALQIPCPRLVLYREDSSDSVQHKLLEQMQEGGSCGLISDAGTPGISDPGWKLVSQCHARGIAVHSLAGPCSLAAALSTAGQPSRRFLFAGFPPHKKSERRAFLQELCQQTVSTVFFETPHQIGETLQWLAQCCEPDRSMSICRELTKLHESNQKRRLADWLLDPPPARGEFVLILEGCPMEPDKNTGNTAEQAAYLLKSGLSAAQTREFLEQFAQLPRNQAYRLVLECQQKISAKPD
ncbi:MAG: 16S rRNA (cytidine(1402)-2'-O)-methyltransferase [Candidatus Eremiobacteraeota bacterium]|nr:16S rRNA (cytidine(1402)-2'-O)-methyltransferase [Candidatus Eremiobacteraeota bacterium]